MKKVGDDYCTINSNSDDEEQSPYQIIEYPKKKSKSNLRDSNRVSKYKHRQRYL